MRFLSIIACLLLIFSCSNKNNDALEINQQFSSEMHDLKEYFHIPGLAISVSKNGEEIYSDFKGFADLENKIELDSDHLFPIASLTKVFTGVVMMKLVEEGKLDLDSPVKEFFPKLSSLSDSIQVKHILSHTSQGKVGEKFYYSSRFSLLTRVIEKASGMSFSAYLERSIFSPLQLENTYLLRDSTQISQNNLKLALPYVYEGETKKGFIDYGYSASAGIVSNITDLNTFNKALDKNSIISQESKERMFSSFKNDLPYGYGIFSQNLMGKNVVWAYGQYDSYSSLFLKVPEEDLTLILLANNNLMSDPARLIYGDISSSLFALSFFGNYLPELVKENSDDFAEKKLLARSLSDSFFARYDDDKFTESKELILSLTKKNSDLIDNGNINLLHNLTFLKDVAFYKKLGVFNTFDIFIEDIGKELHQQDPYVNMYLGSFYLRSGRIEDGQYHLEKVVNAKNFSRNWYTVEGEDLLRSLH